MHMDHIFAFIHGDFVSLLFSIDSIHQYKCSHKYHDWPRISRSVRMKTFTQLGSCGFQLHAGTPILFSCSKEYVIDHTHHTHLRIPEDSMSTIQLARRTNEKTLISESLRVCAGIGIDH